MNHHRNSKKFDVELLLRTCDFSVKFEDHVVCFANLSVTFFLTNSD